MKDTNLYRVSLHLEHHIMRGTPHHRSSKEWESGFVTAASPVEAVNKAERHYAAQRSDTHEITVHDVKASLAGKSDTGFFVNFCLV